MSNSDQEEHEEQEQSNCINNPVAQVDCEDAIDPMPQDRQVLGKRERKKRNIYEPDFSKAKANGVGDAPKQQQTKSKKQKRRHTTNDPQVTPEIL